jgi:hypothetical protein
MNPDCRPKHSFAVSICRDGHATLHLGRSAVFLDVDEFRRLIQAAQNALVEYDKATQPEKTPSLLEEFWSQISH